MLKSSNEVDIYLITVVPLAFVIEYFLGSWQPSISLALVGVVIIAFTASGLLVLMTYTSNQTESLPKNSVPRLRSEDHLVIKDLEVVFTILTKHHFNQTRYYELGLQLGLYTITLSTIERDERGDTARCLLSCLDKWLRQVDGVRSKPPSWYQLIHSLKQLGENAVADSVCIETCMIYSRHNRFWDYVDVSIATFLCRENVINERTRADIETVQCTSEEQKRILSTAVKNAICLNYRNLEKVGVILLKFTNAGEIGNNIHTEYKKYFSSSVPECIGDISYLPKEFGAMKTKFADAIYEVYLAMKDYPPLEQLKQYLRLGYANLRPRLNHCKNNDEILEVVSDNCSLIDISLLEAVVNKFEIEQVKQVIKEYKKNIEEFCNTELRLCLNKWLSSPSPLQSEAITFIIGHQVNDCTLNHVRGFIVSTFQEHSFLVRVVVIRESNSFTVKCFFPIAHSELLITSALKNIEVLRKRGLSSLTIGYCTVYNYELQKNWTRQEIISAVYASKHRLEQLEISSSVQLIEKDKELASLKKTQVDNKTIVVKDPEGINSKLTIAVKEEREDSSSKMLQTKEKMIKALIQENEKLLKSKTGSELLWKSESILQASKTMVAVARHRHYLRMEDISEVTRALKKRQYTGLNYHDLGQSLGISGVQLTDIRRNHGGDVDLCLLKCLSVWLGSKYDDEGSGPTWESFIDALKSIHEDVIAHGVFKEKCLACGIFVNHYFTLSISIEKPLQIAEYFDKKAIFSTREMQEIKSMGCTVQGTDACLEQTNTLLTKIQEAVCKDYRNLETFATYLQSIPSTRSEATEILEECNALRRITIPIEWHVCFTLVRDKFDEAYRSLCSHIEKMSPFLETIKEHCEERFPGILKSGLDHAQNTKEFFNHFADKILKITDIAELDELAKNFKIETDEVTSKINGCKRELVKLYQDIKNYLCQLKVSSDPTFSFPANISLLQEVTYVLDWETARCSLKDVRDILSVVLDCNADYILDVVMN